MGIQDRDWYRESYREKERKYGSDFSSRSSSSKTNDRTVTIKPHKSSGLKTVMIYIVIVAVVLGIILAIQSPEVKGFIESMMKK